MVRKKQNLIVKEIYDKIFALLDDAQVNFAKGGKHEAGFASNRASATAR